MGRCAWKRWGSGVSSLHLSVFVNYKTDVKQMYPSPSVGHGLQRPPKVSKCKGVSWTSWVQSSKTRIIFRFLVSTLKLSVPFKVTKFRTSSRRDWGRYWWDESHNLSFTRKFSTLYVFPFCQEETEKDPSPPPNSVKGFLGTIETLEGSKQLTRSLPLHGR